MAGVRPVLKRSLPPHSVLLVQPSTMQPARAMYAPT